MSPPAVAAQGVSRDLGEGETRTRVLRGIDLEVAQGEFLALTGPSGSGKSTLLYLLGVLDRPTEGRVMMGDLDPATLDDNGRAELRGRRLGFVFQFHFLLPEFTSLENVMLPLLRRRVGRTEAARRAHEALATVDLDELAERKPNQLSGGQQQRVSIARAIANDPAILLADEPTGNLDSKNGDLVVGAFERLTRDRGQTIVMVTHSEEFARRCSRRVSLRDGVIA